MSSIKRYCIHQDHTLYECLQCIDRSAAGIVMVVDETFKLIGTLSDGDIRRALLQGYPLDSPLKLHVNQGCFSVSPDENRVKVLDIMQARRFAQVPIVNDEGTVIGIHLLHDILGQKERPNWAVIMAGGKGARLRPYTEHLPKPMLKVAGRPILERIILHLVSHGIKHIFISVNYLAHIIEDFFTDGSHYGCRIEYLREKEILGSGGALSLLPKSPKHPLLLMNGDLIMDVNIAGMFDFHEKHDFHATMGVAPYSHEVPYGCVTIENNQLIALEEKPLLQQIVNAGIYVLSPKAVAAIPASTFYPITDLFNEALTQDKLCGTYQVGNEWLDIGHPQELKQARGLSS